MIKSRVLLSVAGLMLFVTRTAYAEESATPAAPPAAVDPKLAIVCREYPPPTGSLIGGRRVCQTKEKWDADDALMRSSLHDYSQKNLEHSVAPPNQTPSMSH